MRFRCALILAALLSTTGCSVGACLGTGGIFDHTYCYSDFTADECDDYAAEGVNGASWDFYPGDTCDDLGYLEGSN